MTKKCCLNIVIILLVSFSLARGKCDADEVINPQAEAGGVFVKAGTRTTKNGKTWKTAYSDLQKGIEDAFKNNKKKVYVAQGTYTPTSWPNSADEDKNNGRNNHFSLRNGVEVIGGFPGEKVDESNNPEQYKTILSGNIGTKDNDSDNVYHVFYHPATAKLDKTAKLVRVIIAKGNANSFFPHNNGGGMANSNSSPTLTNVKFNSNTAKDDGGGMYNNNSTPELTTVTFTNNKATYDGGGMYNSNNSSPTLKDVEFTSNEATNNGGGMFNYNNSSPNFTGKVTFNKNIAGVYDPNSPNDPTKNKVGKGGAIYNNNSSITGEPEYGKGDDENKKVVKVGDIYKYVKSELESGQ